MGEDASLQFASSNIYIYIFYWNVPLLIYFSVASATGSDNLLLHINKGVFHAQHSSARLPACVSMHDYVSNWTQSSDSVCISLKMTLMYLSVCWAGLQLWGHNDNSMWVFVVGDMVDNVSTILMAGNQNPPFKTEENLKGGDTICFFFSRTSTTNKKTIKKMAR